MLISCWSVKGGSGTTIVACGLAMALSKATTRDVLLADLAGDVPTALGLEDSPMEGLGEWFAAGPDVPHDAFDALSVEATKRLRVISSGRLQNEVADEDVKRLLTALDRDFPVVVDCGSISTSLGMAIASASDVSFIVLRACYLGLRRAVGAPVRPTGAVLIREPARALGRRDIEEVLGVPVTADIPYDPAIARSVDAGLLAKHLPRQLERALRPVVSAVVGEITDQVASY